MNLGIHEHFKWFLGNEYEEILKWAVGENFKEIPFVEYPKRMHERIGLEVTLQTNIDVSLIELKKLWNIYKTK